MTENDTWILQEALDPQTINIIPTKTVYWYYHVKTEKYFSY